MPCDASGSLEDVVDIAGHAWVALTSYRVLFFAVTATNGAGMSVTASQEITTVDFTPPTMETYVALTDTLVLAGREHASFHNVLLSLLPLLLVVRS